MNSPEKKTTNSIVRARRGLSLPVRWNLLAHRTQAVLTPGRDGDRGCANRTSSNGQRPDRLPPPATASRRRGRRRGPPSFPRRKEQEGRVLRPARGGSGMERAAAAALGCALRSPSPSPSPAPQWPPLLRCHRRCPPGPPRPLLPPALRFR